MVRDHDIQQLTHMCNIPCNLSTWVIYPVTDPHEWHTQQLTHISDIPNNWPTWVIYPTTDPHEWYTQQLIHMSNIPRDWPTWVIYPTTDPHEWYTQELTHMSDTLSNCVTTLWDRETPKRKENRTEAVQLRCLQIAGSVHFVCTHTLRVV